MVSIHQLTYVLLNNAMLRVGPETDDAVGCRKTPRTRHLEKKKKILDIKTIFCGYFVSLVLSLTPQVEIC